jgi:outer membrane receptor protein involved in Fe transport
MDYHRVSGTDTGDIFAETRQQIRTDIGRGKQDGLGAYVLASVAPTPALDILASLRWDYWRNFDGFDGTTGRGVVPTKTADAVSPRIGARYRVTSLVAIRAAAYGAFNAPNLDNLYRAFSTPGFIGLPNSQLDPERGRGFEAGVDITHAHTRAQVTAFNATIRDAITSRNLDPAEPNFPPGFEFASLNINAGKLRSRGVETEVTQALYGSWIIDGAYTFADAVITDNPLDPSSVGVQIQGVPKHAINAGIAHEPTVGFGGSLRLRWTSAYKALFSNNPLDSAAVADASVRYAFTNRLALYANIQNLFNQNYLADDNGFLPPQRGTPLNVFVGVRARLN